MLHPLVFNLVLFQFYTSWSFCEFRYQLLILPPTPWTWPGLGFPVFPPTQEGRHTAHQPTDHSVQWVLANAHITNYTTQFWKHSWLGLFRVLVSCDFITFFNFGKSSATVFLNAFTFPLFLRPVYTHIKQLAVVPQVSGALVFLSLFYIQKLLLLFF